MVDERRALLAQPNDKAPTGVRDRAFMATMLHAGLRCAEAINLRPRDIEFNATPAPLIRVVRGKGGKDRVVPIDPLLEEYLREWRARRPSSERFFCTLAGRPLGDRRMRTMVKRRGQRAGVNDVHPHLLRHTCATVWLAERKLDLHEVQLLLGHARLTTTQRYLHASLPTLSEKFRAFS
jgi:site-specific recombinase XerD